MAVCSPSIRGRLLGGYQQPGKDARRIGMRVHDRAACRRQPLHDNVVKAGEEARCAPAVERIYL